MINPRGLITSDMFNITIYNSNNKVLFQNIDPVGPNVTMTLLPAPQSVTYIRNNYTNGINYDLTFLIRPTNYIEVNDVMRLKIPRPLHFTDNTICRGDGYWAKGTLECTQSGDKLTAEIKMSINGKYVINSRRELGENENDDDSDSDDFVPQTNFRGRRLLDQFIPSNSLMLVTLTNISSTDSLRPSTGIVEYSLTSVDEKPLEKADIELTFQNREPAWMDPNKAGVSPNLWDENQAANYTLTFFPVGYEMGMYADVYVNRRIGIPSDFGKNNKSCSKQIGDEHDEHGHGTYFNCTFD